MENNVKNILYTGQNIQEWTKQNLRKTAFKIFERVWPASYIHHRNIKWNLGYKYKPR